MMKYKLYAPLDAYSEYAVNLRFKLEQSSSYKKRRVRQQETLLNEHYRFKNDIEKKQTYKREFEIVGHIYISYYCQLKIYAEVLTESDNIHKHQYYFTAEDLVNETALRIMNNEKYRYKSLPYAFWRKSLKRIFIEFKAKHDKKRIHEHIYLNRNCIKMTNISETGSIELNRKFIETDTFQDSVWKDIYNKLKARKKLTPFQVDVWELYLQNYSNKEISEQTGLNFSQVKNNLCRVRRKLRQCIRKDSHIIWELHETVKHTYDLSYYGKSYKKQNLSNTENKLI